MKTAVLIYLAVETISQLAHMGKGHYTAQRSPAYHFVGALVFALLAWYVWSRP